MKVVMVLYGICFIGTSLLSGCDSSPAAVTPPPLPAGSVSVQPSEVELLPGTSQSLQVTVRDEAGDVVPSAAVSWSSSAPDIATITDGGLVRALGVGNARIVASSLGASDTVRVRVVPGAPSTSTVEVYPEVRYQVMTGWEGVAEIGEVECGTQHRPALQAELIDRLVNELGINRIRLEVRSGHENPEDHYPNYAQSTRPADWYQYRYASINDNDDPYVIREGGFHFAEIDHKVDLVVEPVRRALQARGERLYLNLTYVDFGVASWEQSSNPEEYAELLLAAFQHLKTRYGWVPDAVEVSLEPDNTPNWKPEVIGRALVAAGDRLKAAGYRPAFIAPSNTNMTTAVNYLDGLLAVPRVREYLTDVAYHRYSGVSSAALTGLADRALAYGLRTGMLEHIGSGYQDLHEDLKVGRNSAWQQFTLAWCSTLDLGAEYYLIDTVASRPILGTRSRYLRQYFSYVRLDAERIGAVSGTATLDPLAFRNTNGKLVTIIRATGAASVNVRRLPAGTYGVTVTTSSLTFAPLPDIVVGTDGALQVSMPAAGVMSIFQR